MSNRNISMDNAIAFFHERIAQNEMFVSTFLMNNIVSPIRASLITPTIIPDIIILHLLVMRMGA